MVHVCLKLANVRLLPRLYPLVILSEDTRTGRVQVEGPAVTSAVIPITALKTAYRILKATRNLIRLRISMLTARKLQ